MPKSPPLATLIRGPIGDTKGFSNARFKNFNPSSLGVGLSLTMWCIMIQGSRFTVPRVTPTHLSKLGTLSISIHRCHSIQWNSLGYSTWSWPQGLPARDPWAWPRPVSPPMQARKNPCFPWKQISIVNPYNPCMHCENHCNPKWFMKSFNSNSNP